MSGQGQYSIELVIMGRSQEKSVSSLTTNTFRNADTTGIPRPFVSVTFAFLVVVGFTLDIINVIPMICRLSSLIRNTNTALSL